MMKYRRSWNTNSITKKKNGAQILYINLKIDKISIIPVIILIQSLCFDYFVSFSWCFLQSLRDKIKNVKPPENYMQPRVVSALQPDKHAWL